MAVCTICGEQYSVNTVTNRTLHTCPGCNRANSICPVCGDTKPVEIGQDIDGNRTWGCNACMTMFTIQAKEYGEQE